MIKSELGMLVKQLNEKDKRYSNFALRTLKERSAQNNEVYRYWDVFELKLINGDANQKKMGLILLAANAQWDSLNKLDLIIDDIIEICSNPVPAVVLQALECLDTILQIKPHLSKKIEGGLKSANNEEWTEQDKNKILEKINTFTK